MKSSNYVDILYLAKLHAAAFLFLGIVCGVLYSFGGFAIDALVSLGWMSSAETPGLSYGTLLAFMALIGMPAVFGTFGFITGGVVALLYNIAVWIFSGLRFFQGR